MPIVDSEPAHEGFLSQQSNAQLNKLDRWLSEEQDRELSRLYTTTKKGNDASFIRETAIQAGRVEELENLRLILKRELDARSRQKQREGTE